MSILTAMPIVAMLACRSSILFSLSLIVSIFPEEKVELMLEVLVIEMNRHRILERATFFVMHEN